MKNNNIKTRKTIWEFFINNFKFTAIFLLAIIFLGIFSIIKIPKESQPDIEIPIIIVNSIFSGANAEDVEELVTNVIEDKLINLEDIKDVTSTSIKGMSTIVVQFDVDADVTKKLNDVKDKVDLAKAELPDDVKDPIIQKVRLSDMPILTLSISGQFSVIQLKKYAQTIKDEIERISGVSNVQILGSLDREVHIIVNKSSLDHFGLSISQITRAISEANTDIPIGVIENNNLQYTINLNSKLKNVNDLNEVPVTQINGVPILIGDIATVYDGFSIPTSKSRLSEDAKTPQTSIALRVYKTTGGNVVKVVDSVMEKVEQIKKENFPNDVTILKTEDNAQFVRDDLSNLFKNGIQTVLIVVLLLFIFVGFKEAILAGIAIPLTFLITFAFLHSFGFSLNFLTLFSLILSLGILVDSSIVITQGMNDYLKKGYSKKDSSIQTIRDFELPLVSGTLTTVFAFVPMLMSSGILGKYIRTIPITITIVLMSSLFVALGLITALGGKFLTTIIIQKNEDDDLLKSQKKQNFAKQISIKTRKKIEIIMNQIKLKYVQSFENLILSKIKKRLFLIITILLLILSFLLPITGILKVEMFPQSDQEVFYVNLEMPSGTPLEKTDLQIKEIEEKFIGDNRIKSFVVNVGSLSSIGGQSSLLESNKAHIIINLKKERTQKSNQIIKEYENKLAQISGGEITLNQNSEGPENSAPVEVRIKGKSLNELEKIAFEITNLLKKIDGTKNIKTSIKDINPEFVINFDRIKAGTFGVSATQLALNLRNSINGLEATKIKNNGEETSVIVKYELDEAKTQGNITNKVDITTIENLTLPTQNNIQIPISSFSKSTLGASRQSISHKDGKRIVIVSSDTNNVSAQIIFDKLGEQIKNLKLQDGYTIEMGGEREDIQESFSDMFRAMIIGILLIAGLLVLQFNSYSQPLFILATIPLALIAVFIGLTFIGLPLSFPGIIGVVALIGIVVNNAIILIDKININIENGLSKIDAIKDSALSRFEPILLTTITTVLGILPLAINDVVWGPLGWSIVFGLTFSTILTLFVIPLLCNHFMKDNKQ